MTWSVIKVLTSVIYRVGQINISRKKFSLPKYKIQNSCKIMEKYAVVGKKIPPKNEVKLYVLYNHRNIIN